MAENEKSTTVKSVFKSGESTTTEQEFTEMWTRLINTLEKGKSENFLLKSVTKEPVYGIITSRCYRKPCFASLSTPERTLNG